MSDLKKVLTLVACGCICLMVATSASADYVGVTSVNKGGGDSQHEMDINLLCVQGTGPFVPDTGLTVCNVYAIFNDPADRMLSVGNSELQVFDGETPNVFFQHPNNFSGSSSPACGLIPVFPDVICDTFITIGYKCAPIDPEDGTTADGDFEVGEFNNNGHIVGGWFNGDPFNLQGDAGTWPDLQVLFLQSSVALGLSMSGDLDIFWLDQDTGETIAEENVEIECAAKCTPGGECNDFDPCTDNDECIDGNCVGTPIVCPDDGNDCTDDFCDSDAGGCVNVNVPDGTGCNDGNDCTSPDTCTDGQCGGVGCQTDSDCNDQDPCTTDICDAGTGCCTNTPDCTSDGDCGDGIDCTVDTCNGNCCSNAPDDDACDDGNLCTDNTCDADSGCTSTPNNVGCDDGDQCTTGDTCSGGSCAGEDVPCPPGADCNPDNGECEFCQTDADCDDGLNCNGAETCDPGTGCQAGTDVDCSGEDDECNAGVCVEPGDCVQEPANEGDTCDDETACTENDTCSGGSCSGEPLPPCPEGQVCDPGTGDCVDAPSGFLDIIPGKCPNRLREHGLGFLKVSLVSSAIEGEEFDACDANVDSLLLVNDSDPNCGGAVAPRTTPRPICRDRATPFLGELCDCHSRRKDGLDDLDMKFKLSELRTELCLDALPAGTVITLCLTGEMNDGSPINVCDCVMVDRPGGGTPGPGGG